MNEQLIQQELAALAAASGVQACALVDGRSGLVWHAEGRMQVEQPLWEAAVDYWRLHSRMSAHFAPLGELGAAVMYHRHAMLVVLPCASEGELLVVCVAAHGGVDWLGWQRRARGMGERLLLK